MAIYRSLTSVTTPQPRPTPHPPPQKKNSPALAMKEIILALFHFVSSPVMMIDLIKEQRRCL